MRYRFAAVAACCGRSALARAAAVVLIVGGAAAAPFEHKVLDLSIINGRVPSVGDTIKVKQGDELELRWSSDRPVDLHLHGYDIETKVAPHAPAVMSFRATLPGRFPIEAHGPGREPHRAVLYLEVYP